MKKADLMQVKVFLVSDYETSELLEKAVNDYVVEIYNKTNNYPEIETNSKFISVLYDLALEVNAINNL